MLDRELPALGVDRMQAEQRQPAEVLERDVHVDALEQARHERDLAGRAPRTRARAGSAPRSGAELKPSTTCSAPVSRATSARSRAAQHRGACGSGTSRPRAGGRPGSRPGSRPSSGWAKQAPLDVGADLAGADDQGGLRRQACHTRATVRPAQQQPPGHQVERPEQPRPPHQRRRIGVGVEQRHRRDQGNGGERGRRQHLADTLQRPQLDRIPVQPPDRQQAEHQWREQPDQADRLTAGLGRRRAQHRRRGAQTHHRHICHEPQAATSQGRETTSDAQDDPARPPRSPRAPLAGFHCRAARDRPGPCARVRFDGRRVASAPHRPSIQLSLWTLRDQAGPAPGARVRRLMPSPHPRAPRRHRRAAPHRAR